MVLDWTGLGIESGNPTMGRVSSVCYKEELGEDIRTRSWISAPVMDVNAPAWTLLSREDRILTKQRPSKLIFSLMQTIVLAG